MMIWRKASLVVAVMAVLVGGGLCLAQQGFAAAAAMSTSTVSWHSNPANLVTAGIDPALAGTQVMGAVSMLVRTDSGVTMTLNTHELPPGAYTVWWVFFNHPEDCTPPGCGSDDLFPYNDAAMPDVTFAAGHVVGHKGEGNFAAYRQEGDTFKSWFRVGLLNPRGAEIHLIVRTHGDPLPGLVSEQIRTFGGGCGNVPANLLALLAGNEVLGELGPNACADIQVAIHMP